MTLFADQHQRERKRGGQNHHHAIAPGPLPLSGAGTQTGIDVPRHHGRERVKIGVRRTHRRGQNGDQNQRRDERSGAAEDLFCVTEQNGDEDLIGLANFFMRYETLAGIGRDRVAALIIVELFLCQRGLFKFFRPRFDGANFGDFFRGIIDQLRRIEYPRTESDEHDTPQKTERQNRRENHHAPFERFRRFRRIIPHPLRRLHHRGDRAEKADGPECGHGVASGIAGKGQRRFGELCHRVPIGGRSAQHTHDRVSGDQHSDEEQTPLNCVGQRNAAHPPDDNINHQHGRDSDRTERVDVEPGEGTGPLKQHFGHQTPGANLHDDIGQKIEESEQRD